MEKDPGEEAMSQLFHTCLLLPLRFGQTRRESGWDGLRLSASKVEQQLGYAKAELVNKREVPQSRGDLDQSSSGVPRDSKEEG